MARMMHRVTFMPSTVVTLVIPALRRLKQGDKKFEDSLGYRVSPCFKIH
jgi:hypothetical protein